MYKRNNAARLRNHRCCRKVINITYSEFVSLALVTQNLKRTRRIAICVLPGSTIFFRIISYRHDFRGKKFLNTKCVF